MAEKIVLLAEDDSAHAALISRVIEEADHRWKVAVVGNGAEVIEYLFATGPYSHRNGDDMPVLVLLDLKMPQMDGLQVLQVLRRVRCRNQTPLPPVVVLTSSKDDADVAMAYELGAHSYVHKPATLPDLAEAVQQVAGYWLRLNRSPSACQQLPVGLSTCRLSPRQDDLGQPAW